MLLIVVTSNDMCCMFSNSGQTVQMCSCTRDMSGPGEFVFTGAKRCVNWHMFVHGDMCCMFSNSNSSQTVQMCSYVSWRVCAKRCVKSICSFMHGAVVVRYHVVQVAAASKRAARLCPQGCSSQLVYKLVEFPSGLTVGRSVRCKT